MRFCWSDRIELRGCVRPDGCAEAVVEAARAASDPSLNRLACRLLASQLHHLRQRSVPGDLLLDCRELAAEVTAARPGDQDLAKWAGRLLEQVRLTLHCAWTRASHLRAWH